MFAFDVRLEPSEYLAAWKPDAKRLTVKTPSAPRLREKVAVRIQLTTPSVRATVVGTVVSLSRQDARHCVELTVEAESLDAVRMLLAAAKGEPVTFRERPPRYLAKLPVLTSRGGTSIYLTSVSVSTGGCSLRWPGSMPTLGEAVNLRFRGSRSVDMRGVVCWRKPANKTVGLRFVERPAAGDAWQALLQEVNKSGTPTT
ncbi:MAG TPA: PilZ domain-containing protein [Anaeromyxobacteraceae bacterium]